MEGHDAQPGAGGPAVRSGVVPGLLAPGRTREYIARVQQASSEARNGSIALDHKKRKNRRMPKGDTQQIRSFGVTDKVQAECVRLLFAFAPRALTGSLLVTGLVGYTLWDAAPRGQLVFWMTAMLAVDAVSYGFQVAYRQQRIHPSRAVLWENLYAGKAAAAGAVWGMVVWLLFPHDRPEYQVLLVLTVCIVCLGATAALLTSRPAYWAFLAAAVVPGALYIVTLAARPAAMMGAGMLIYMVFLLGIHHHLNRLIHHSITLSVESDAIAQEQQVIFDSSADAIGFLRPHYLVKCNRQWCELFGYSMDDVIGKPSWMLHPSYDEWKDLARDCQPTLAAGGVYRRVVQLRRKSGELFHAEIRGMAVDPNDLDRGTVWIGSDITERRRMESDLRQGEMRFRSLLSLSSDWYWEIDRDFRITQLSGSVLEQYGYPVEQALGKRQWEIEHMRGVSLEQWRAHRAALEAHLPFRDFCYRMTTLGGEERWFSISGNPAFDENGDFAGYHGVGADITNRIRTAEQFRHLAYHDSLTGLPNRRLFADRLEQSVARAKRDGSTVVVMLLDLDDFKIINDSHGHTAGDSVIKIAAARLRGCVRESDTVARLGGDEFVVLLPVVHHPRDAAAVADKIIEALQVPVPVGDRKYRLGVSIGIALFPDDGLSGEALMQRADGAMYEAKRGGGSRYRFRTTRQSDGAQS